MSETKLATKADLKEMYDRMLPYMGGSADAGFTPIGTVISIMSNHAPANYLICDGTVYNIADYPELANHFLNEFGSKNYFGGNGTTTFAVPDLRGEFLRGTGTNSHENQGSGGEVGEHQDGTAIPNLYYDANGGNFALLNERPDSMGGTSTAPRNIDSSITGNSNLHYVSKSGDAIVTSSSSHFFTRPTNTSVLYCIATKNIYLNPSNDYSTDEKIVGTWINGKPLYQRTFSGTVTELNTDTAIAIGSNIDYAMIINATMKQSDIAVYDLYLANNAMDAYFKLWVNLNGNVGKPNKISMRTSQSNWLNQTVYVTLQYTKTTS